MTKPAFREIVHLSFADLVQQTDPIRLEHDCSVHEPCPPQFGNRRFPVHNKGVGSGRVKRDRTAMGLQYWLWACTFGVTLTCCPSLAKAGGGGCPARYVRD